MPHKLLLADDSVTIQRVIELTFADEDIQVIAVGDGAQAIQRVQLDRPDIVLADVGMPERDGYEVATFIKATPEYAHIPVLLLTGAFEPIDERRARAAGCDGVLVKPFEPQMVISRVKDLIAGRRPAPAGARLGDGTSAPAETTRAAAALAPAGGAVVPAAPATASGSIEDYFDRLDAAFASLESETSAPAAHPLHTDAGFVPPAPAAPGGGLAAELADWDPDLSLPSPAPGSGLADEPQESVPSIPAAQSLSTPVVPDHVDTAPPLTQPAAAAAAPSSPLPSLAEAFAALLAAEQGQAFAPAAQQRDLVNDDTIEQVTRRVIERLGDGAVREVVVEVAERLVREEIARLKAHAR